MKQLQSLRKIGKQLPLVVAVLACASKAGANDWSNWYCSSAEFIQTYLDRPEYLKNPSCLENEELPKGVININPGCETRLPAQGVTLRCVADFFLSKGRFWSPTMRELYAGSGDGDLQSDSDLAIASKLDPTKGEIYSRFISHSPNRWTASDIDREAASRLYWINLWKSERARVLNLEARVRALSQRCGAKCK
jgi:hypothetical protein